MTNRRTRQAALRVLLLVEEFSSEELAAAVSLIGGQEGEDLLTYLSRIAEGPRQPNGSRSKDAKLKSRGETRALQEMKRTDPAKYEILREFETLVREGEVLRSMDDFRAFGKVLGKDFMPGKSRKESIGRLMAVLAQMDLESVRAAITRVPLKTSEEESAFRRLANQIISGQPNHTANSTLQP
jgi:hypothetical protein